MALVVLVFDLTGSGTGVAGANEPVIHWLLTPPRQRPTREHIAYALTQLFLAATTIEAPPARRRRNRKALST